MIQPVLGFGRYNLLQLTLPTEFERSSLRDGRLPGQKAIWVATRPGWAEPGFSQRRVFITDQTPDLDFIDSVQYATEVSQ